MGSKKSDEQEQPAREKLKGKEYERALIDLHEAVWERRGHQVPWIRVSNGKISVRPDVALKAPPQEGEWDLRWVVAHELIRRTGWRPR